MQAITLKYLDKSSGVSPLEAISEATTKEDLRRIAASVFLTFLRYDYYSVLVSNLHNPIQMFSEDRKPFVKTDGGNFYEGRAYHFEEKRILTNTPEEYIKQLYGEDPTLLDPSKFYAQFTYDMLYFFADVEPTGKVRNYHNKIMEIFDGPYTGFKMTSGLHMPGDRHSFVTLRLLRTKDDDHTASNEVLKIYQYDLAALLQKLATRYQEIHYGTPGLLSPSELDALRLLAHGLSAREIGATLNKSPATVNKQLESVRWKLDARNSTHAVAKALSMHLIEV